MNQLHILIWISNTFMLISYFRFVDLMHLNGSTIIEGPDLPIPITEHCVVNSDELMKAFVIGGLNTINFNWVVIFSLNNQTWEYGPNLIFARRMHACGILKDGNDHIIVVAGGLGDSGPLSSVELYNLESGNGWYSGPDLAKPR